MNIMSEPVDGPPLDYDIMPEVDKPQCHEQKALKSQRFPNDINRKMRAGLIVRCHMHKISISRNNNKYALYNMANDTLSVIVRFSYLESTLIPFGEPTESSDKYMPR